MNATDLYPKSNLTGTGKLRPEDLGGKLVTLTIRECGTETYNGKTNVVLYFGETDKCFAVKNSNGRAMIDAFGPETDEWEGKRIVVGPGPEFEDQAHPGKMIQWIKIQEQETSQLEQKPAPPREKVGQASDVSPF